MGAGTAARTLHGDDELGDDGQDLGAASMVQHVWHVNARSAGLKLNEEGIKA